MAIRRLGGGLLTVACTLGAVVLPLTIPDPSQDQLVVLWIALFLLAAAGMAMAFWPEKGEKRAIPMGDTYSNSGNNFGHMGPVNNYGPQKLVFSNETAASLKELLKEKKPIVLQTVGSESDQAVGGQFRSYLVEQGYEIAKWWRIGTKSPPPDHKIEVFDEGVEYTVVIAPSA